MTIRRSVAGFSLCVASVLAAIGCGDDSGGGAGTGGYGGADAAVSGGSGGSGGADSGTPPVDTAACVAAGDSASAMGFATRPAGCKQCLCQKCDTAAISACDDNCWALIGCVGDKCAGLVDPERTSCAVAMCLDFLSASGPAMAVGMCGFGTDSCETACRGSSDAGTGNDAGSDTDGG